MAASNRKSIADIQQEVRTQLHARVAEAVGLQIQATQKHVAILGQDAKSLGKRLAQAKRRVSATEEKLNEQRDTITKLVVMTLGHFPYTYLLSIFNKKNGKDPNTEFMWRSESSFQREIGVLIDGGYLENVNLSTFDNQENVLDKLTLTEKGELYVEFREQLSGKAS